jgi:hypothetical protein
MWPIHLRLDLEKKGCSRFSPRQLGIAVRLEVLETVFRIACSLELAPRSSINVMA